MILDEKTECMSRAEVEAMQLSKFNELLNRLQESPLYSQELPHSITNLEEISQLPYTEKKDLREAYPFGSLITDYNDVAEIHTSSGTTGKPSIMLLTRDDIARSNEALARTWVCNGLRKNDVFAMLGAYGLFTGGLINHYAVQTLGTTVVPIGAISSKKQLEYLRDFNVTVVAGIAGHFYRLSKQMDELGMGSEDFSLRLIIAAGEPYSEEYRSYIEKAFGCPVRDQYGLAEINTGLAGECEHRCGLHLPHDYVYPEIIHPETKEILEVGEQGELVLTTFDRQANPVLRYRTGDLTSLKSGPCECGRTTPRIARISGRIDNTIFIKGVKIPLKGVETALWQQQDIIDPHDWRVVTDRQEGKERMVLEVCPKKDLSRIAEKLQRFFRSKFGIRIEISRYEGGREHKKTRYVNKIDK